VLILREVLRWKASEVADLLDTTVVSVNSALQRARSTLAADDIESTVHAGDPMDDEQRALLMRYVEAFERFDIDALVALLHEDAPVSMPPYELWMRGPDALARWLRGSGAGCRGSRLVPVAANGAPAFAQWRPDGPDGRPAPWAIHVLEIAGGRITA